jgi:hypothetical protein
MSCSGAGRGLGGQFGEHCGVSGWAEGQPRLQRFPRMTLACCIRRRIAHPRPSRLALLANHPLSFVTLACRYPHHVCHGMRLTAPPAAYAVFHQQQEEPRARACAGACHDRPPQVRPRPRALASRSPACPFSVCVLRWPPPWLALRTCATPSSASQMCAPSPPSRPRARPGSSSPSRECPDSAYRGYLTR